MKRIFSVWCVVFMLSSVALTAPHGDYVVSEMVELRENKLVRVTKEPHVMADTTAMLCSSPIMQPQKIHDGYHKPAYCHVYVSKEGEQSMLSGNGKYPSGTIIVKSKLSTKDAKQPELFTVMRKMGEGYNSKQGDWEYSVLEGKSHKVLSRGRIDSCIDCHAHYEKTDFVTRGYLSRK